MSNGVPDSEDIGTTFSKLSKARIVKSAPNAEDGTAQEGGPGVISNMEEGAPVQYDDISNGSYPDGTLPGLSKNWGKKDEVGLNEGFDMHKAIPTYLEGGGPKTVDF